MVVISPCIVSSLSRRHAVRANVFAFVCRHRVVGLTLLVWLHLSCAAASQVLGARCDRTKSLHTVSDLNDLLTPEARSMLDALTPAADASADDRVAAYERMDDILSDSSDAFQAVSPCTCCDVGAPLAAMRGLDVAFGSPITVWVSGTSCFDHSKRGNMQRSAGRSMRPFLIWKHLVKKMQPHVILQEITPSPHARAMMRAHFADMYDFHHRLTPTRRHPHCPCPHHKDVYTLHSTYSDVLCLVEYLLIPLCAATQG
jgi:hypothetical protein